jgi:GNAT superfamily N-acetyltransferase
MVRPEVPGIVAAERRGLTAALRAQVDAIFFDASGRGFRSEAERAAFHERWLGRYLLGGTDVVLLAMADEQTVAGYLVGSIEDPSVQDRFADISYFSRDFRDLCRRYPAHLHVNLRPASRGRGLGARLVETFASRVRDAGAPGLHVVTGKQARNATFYARCGFTELGTADWNGGAIVFLGRPLAGVA